MTSDSSIGDYGLIGDTRTAALVSPDGSIDWWCVPRFDSPPLFGCLIGGDGGGRFRVSPASASPSLRRYLDGTVTLETEWRDSTGATVTLADSMIGEVSGRLAPSSLLVRRVTATGGPVVMEMHLRPRFGYVQAPPRTIRRTNGGVVFERGDLAIWFSSNGVEWDDRPVTFVVTPNRPVTLSIAVATRSPVVCVPAAAAEADAVRDEAGWRRWSNDIAVGSPDRAAIVRSLLTLQLLTYSPSGAPVAAPTTSLPEVLGGSRNWDYRYAWPRDAAIGIAAFLAYGKTREAKAFLAWLGHASRVDRPRLPALFTLDGRRGTRERVLGAWPGYQGSTPVRVGNGASNQHQLDGYGWVIDATWLAARSGEHLSGETWRMIRGFADFVAHHWSEPDAGIWERRDDVRHHVHSKMMAWLALDRAIRIAEHRGRRAQGRIPTWTTARDEIRADVRSQGYDNGIGTYTAAYGTRDLDAAVLLLPVIGLDPPTSGRVGSTIDRIWAELGAGDPLMYRYRGDDGLAGVEGAFLPCSFWLVQALAMSGRRSEARELFDDLICLGGGLGLYGEEMDPGTRQHLGNFPQALTHAALLQAAMALAEKAPDAA